LGCKLSLRIISFVFALLCSGLAIAGTQQLPQIPPIPRPKSAPISVVLQHSLSVWDKEQRNEAIECASEVAQIKAQDKLSPIEAEFDLSYDVLLEAPTVYSVTVNLNVFCGGAHPDHMETGVAFDLTTGKRYEPLNLYLIATKGEFGYEFRSSIRKMIRQRLIEKRGPSLKDDECIQVLNADDIKFADDGIVALGKDGLTITYSGAHVVQACFAPVVLPYSKLKGYLNKQEAARLRWRQ
jgi:hypothetical protein